MAFGIVGVGIANLFFLWIGIKDEFNIDVGMETVEYIMDDLQLDYADPIRENDSGVLGEIFNNL